jgi:N-methylhydantoinase B
MDDRDPANLEIIRNALESIADSMAIALYRTARSAVVRLGWDFSTAILAANGDLVGQGMCHPVHLGGMMPALAGCLHHYGNDIDPGDILIINDPYHGAQHLPDIYLFKPIFYGGRLIAFAGAICHHADIGGRVPGGQGFDNVEIHQEGLRIPPLKLVSQGRQNETLFRLLEAAVRTPDEVSGDLKACIAAIELGERELVKLVDRFGAEDYMMLTSDLIDYTERLTRRRLETLPDGTWSFTDYIDDDGIASDTITVKATVTKTKDQIRVDFAGSSPQCRGSITGLFHMNANYVYMAMRALLGPDIPNTAGFERPIEVMAPPGSFVNPLPPAAVGARQLGGRRINHAVWGALAQMAPQRCFACPGGSDASMATTGRRADGRSWVLTEGFNETACGGRPDRDGMEGQGSNVTNQANTPVEIIETEYPIRVTRYGFAPDTEGPGKYRGGLALVRDFQYLQDGIEVRTRSDRVKRPPWGVQGGGDAPAGEVSFITKEGSQWLPGKSTLRVRAGDIVHTQWCGGGGYGNPLERDPALVLADVMEDKISLARAHDVYGVVLDPSLRQVDITATVSRRRQLHHTNANPCSTISDPQSKQDAP